ncbi:hypothetical protein K470DRAFT_118300 [Piedraia hortae CBS 480.64]|uniref:Uncharacterized protein n=1 Tax=Piedraia hortae CBS 480.64 TaxID=1314780 RepID=A0A6A7BUL6_9PEZI|nr:hypothetical protein K470DRAFT_118300 [Piedraia hortae CBS 480.64]
MVEALINHVKDKPEMTVDEMLWWLWQTYGIVVGTRTIRRVFERHGQASKSKGDAPAEPSHEAEVPQNNGLQPQPFASSYPSPMPPAPSEEQQMAQALVQPPEFPVLDSMGGEGLPDDDQETLQLELRRLELEKRSVELRLKLRRLHQGKADSVKSSSSEAPSPLYNPVAAAQMSVGVKRDSRSKKKIEETKRRTAERQERMLRDLERRSRRRDHLTAEWVQSKDIWPLRAQRLLAELMHQYGCYAYTQDNNTVFELIYRELYALVDLAKGDWNPQVHGEMLRERMKRKMAQLRGKMLKTGEIFPRQDRYDSWERTPNFAGETAGITVGDEAELDQSLHTSEIPDLQQTPRHDELQFQPVMHHSPTSQYPMVPQVHHPNMLPYGDMNA